MSIRVDLGHGVFAEPVGHSASCSHAQHNDHTVFGYDVCGIIVGHVHEDGQECFGSVGFCPECHKGHDTWTVEKQDPLTLHPSIAAACGLHGFIREGRWVPA